MLEWKDHQLGGGLRMCACGVRVVYVCACERSERRRRRERGERLMAWWGGLRRDARLMSVVLGEDGRGGADGLGSLA